MYIVKFYLQRFIDIILGKKKNFRQLSIMEKSNVLLLDEIKDCLIKSGEITNIVTFTVPLKIPIEQDTSECSEDKQEHPVTKNSLNFVNNFKEIYIKLSKEVQNPIAVQLFQFLGVDQTNQYTRLESIIKSF